MKTAFPALLLTIACGSTALAQTPPNYDFNFVTIGDPGNPAFHGQVPFGSTGPVGRGSVNYAYRASTLEITTGQWMTFLNAFAPLTAAPIDNLGPVYWGAGTTGVLSNGHYTYSLNSNNPHATMLPVGGISWRDAARYCNWLQNGKTVSLAALATGAYDTTTWGDGPGGSITDASNRMPGALYFLPTYDEQLKAMHWDPNRNGPGEGGWWRYKNMTDSPGTPGLPGVGTTNAGYWTEADINAGWSIPLGAYAGQVSPWGLFDTSGGAQEWNEELFTNERGYMGTHAAGDSEELIDGDAIWGMSSGMVRNRGSGPFLGFRVFSAIPSPSGLSAVGIGLVAAFSRKRRIPV